MTFTDLLPAGTVANDGQFPAMQDAATKSIVANVPKGAQGALVSMDRDGAILANGGRVLNVTARGATLAEARARAYAMVDAIDWPDGFCRRDIGWRAL